MSSFLSPAHFIGLPFPSYLQGRYCQLVEQEGGLTLLDEIINRNLVGGGPDRQLQPPSPPAYPKVIELAYIVRENVNRWKEQARGDGLHQAGQQGAANADEELEFDG